MVRSLSLVLLGMVLAGSPSLAAPERGGISGPGPEGRAASSAGPGSGARATGGAVPRQAMLWQVAPIRGRPAAPQDDRAAMAAGGACQRGRGAAAARCRAPAVLGVSGWARNLPPPAGVQTEECPSGTMATLARGHEDIIRCMPL